MAQKLANWANIFGRYFGDSGRLVLFVGGTWERTPLFFLLFSSPSFSAWALRPTEGLLWVFWFGGCIPATKPNRMIVGMKTDRFGRDSRRLMCRCLARSLPPPSRDHLAPFSQCLKSHFVLKPYETQKKPAIEQPGQSCFDARTAKTRICMLRLSF